MDVNQAPAEWQRQWNANGNDDEDKGTSIASD